MIESYTHELNRWNIFEVIKENLKEFGKQEGEKEGNGDGGKQADALGKIPAVSGNAADEKRPEHKLQGK